MPRRKNKARGAPSDKTIPEMKQWYEQNKNKLQWYAQANDALRACLKTFEILKIML